MATPATHLVYEFDDFQLEPDERRLTRRGQLIPLPGKAFEMLLALICNRGRLLTKDELFQLVWPNQIVEESNLTVNMSVIRRALGERASSPHYITTVSGHGYRFTGEVREFAADALTIERESFARVTVDQEETESTKLGLSGAQILRAIGRVTSRPLLLTITAGAVLAIGSVSLWLTLHRTSAAPLRWMNVSFRRFTTREGIPFRVAISPDGKSLVYVQHNKNSVSLWLGQIDTDSGVLISQQPDLGYDGATFSPDGQNLYVTEIQRTTLQTRLVRMPVIGGLATELATNVASVATISPDGRQLAFLRRSGGQSSIIIIDADGQNERVLAERRRPAAFSSANLSWSPDGKLIAVAARDDDGGRTGLLGISVSDGRAQKIGKQDWGFIGNVAWQSDGAGLVLHAKSSTLRRRSEIWFVPYPSGEPRKITNDLNLYYGTMSLSADNKLALIDTKYESEIWLAPDGVAARARVALPAGTKDEGVDGLTWAPDGHLLFSADVADSQAIWEMNSDGANRRQLTSEVEDSVDRQMSVSSDNRFIVFQSNRSGSFQIWRANRDGSNLKQLTTGGVNAQPSISPDANWIVYVSDHDGTATLWRMTIDGGQVTPLTKNNSAAPQISPDGKHVAFLESSNSLHLAIISLSSGALEKTFPLPAVPVNTLAKRMCWTPDGKAILYRNSGEGLWRQRLDANEPDEVKGFEDLEIRQLAWSLDGKTLAYTRTATLQEIVLLQNAR